MFRFIMYKFAAVSKINISISVSVILISISHSCTDNTVCPEGWIRCQTGGQCISKRRWCDFYEDCLDASDEADCGNLISLTTLIFPFSFPYEVFYLVLFGWGRRTFRY